MLVAFGAALAKECPEPIKWTDISKGEKCYQIAASQKSTWIQSKDKFKDGDGQILKYKTASGWLSDESQPTGALLDLAADP